MNLNDRLRFHVTGAIERGEAEAIVGKPTVWIVKGGTMGEHGAFPDVPEGTIEWQMSDGPAGQRSSSSDFISLIEALEAFKGYEFNIDDADFTPAERRIFDHVTQA